MQGLLKKISLFLGPLAYLLIAAFYRPAGLEQNSVYVLATVIWVAIWWVSEAIPLAVTALLPILLLGIGTGIPLKDITTSYGHPYIFLFLGGFVLAIGIEKSGLHRRIALNIILLTGTRLQSVLLGFMLATAFLSMWISNTATVVMMLPLSLASIKLLESQANEEIPLPKGFGPALLLGVAYSASIGGMASLIGTPPNLIFAGIVNEYFGIEITFLQWLKYGLPISVCLLFITWVYLSKYAFKLEKVRFPGGKELIRQQLKELGVMDRAERRTLIIFICTAALWVFHSLIPKNIAPFLNDTFIALLSAFSLVLVSDPLKKESLLNWNDIVKLPWGVLLLFGGGIALAEGFDQSGLATWLGNGIVSLQNLPILLLMLILVASINFVTEITSNLATCAVLLPILAAFSKSLGLDPLTLMVPATLAASCAFMMPVATPPNAIVFGSGEIKIQQMVKTGFFLNLLSIGIICLVIYILNL